MRRSSVGMIALTLMVQTFTCTLSPLNAWQEAETSITVDHVDPNGIRGALILIGGGGTPATVKEAFYKLGGEAEGKLVIIPSASETADEKPLSTFAESWKEDWNSIDVVHRPADDMTGQWLEPLKSATAVWISGGAQMRLANRYADTELPQLVRDVLDRGGVVAGTSAGAAIASNIMIGSGRDIPEMGKGWDLLPRSIVDQHFTQRNRQTRLVTAVTNNPQCVGLGLDESTAIVLQGRTFQVLGEGKVHVYFAATKYYNEQLQQSLTAREYGDWVQLQKTAAERLQPAFPPEAFDPIPSLKGALVIIGGGGTPRAALDRFVELAGGEQAKIVVLPTAVPNPSDDQREAAFLRGRKVASIKVLPQVSPEDVQSDEFLTAINEATGVWFGGGRQWRFVDAYADFPAWQALKGVVERGGVIAGSSAGATIQGDLLVRGHPLGNTIMVADGYRRGLGLLPGVAIDQHFAQRQRFSDLESVVRRFPSVTGIGIDESTALVVKGSSAEVVGRGSVWIYQSEKMPKADTEPDASNVPAEFPSGSKIKLPDWNPSDVEG